jgi:AraC-like DNA-binding protein
MNYVGPGRKRYDEIRTSDVGAFLRFACENLCSVANAGGADAQFEGDAKACSGGEFTIARLATRLGSTQLDRSTLEVRFDNERRYALCLPVVGRLQATQFARTESCPAGSMIMMSGSEPLSLQMSGYTEVLMLMLPPDLIESRMVRPSGVCCRQISKCEGVNGLVHCAVIALEEAAAAMGEAEIRKAALLIGELIVLALGRLSDVKPTGSPVRAANLLRAKEIVRKRCDDPDLTLADVAKECELSLRYMHDLFRDDGRTFREYITHERLMRARRMLETGNAKVTEVCMASGFSSLSHFSTVFRRAFSVSPSEIKRRV